MATEAAEATPSTPPAAPEVPLETILEGWGGKQGWKYPTWKVRYFVLQKKPTPPDSDDVTDARDYFKNSSDSFERAHNYNVKNDKVNLVLTYYTDDTKAEVKEVFTFDENTCWHGEQSRITWPRFMQGPVKAIHLFCKGSRGASKLVFVPFWGFCEPGFKLLLQPWMLSFEFAKPNAFVGENDTYYDDFRKVEEDVFGKTSADLAKHFEEFKKIFDDDVTFKDIKANYMLAAKVFIPIKFLGKNAQEDNISADKDTCTELMNKQTEWQMKFDKKMKELIEEKKIAGSRAAWQKLCAQAKWRNLKFAAWMEIKDKDNNMDSLPANLR